VAHLGVNPDFWQGRNVLVTGHTGFKGAWLSIWLTELGARVVGYALEPPTSPSLFERTGLSRLIQHIHGDVRDFNKVAKAMAVAEPDVVFHLAAQALVLESYKTPLETYSINVMGTANVLEAARRIERPRRRAVLIITSDKCYAHNGKSVAHVETDPLRGDDPYGSSKACAELVAASYCRCFSDPMRGIATVRAGNVIGGGDWAKHRLVPDAIRALIAKEPLSLRHPNATRPFQHVLDPLVGYLLLAQALYDRPAEFSESWNFGPDVGSETSVKNVINLLGSFWGTPCDWSLDQKAMPHETDTLALDSRKSRSRLAWQPRLTLNQALRLAADWYREEALRPTQMMLDFTLDQIRAFGALASEQKQSII
jgi:CDP-glucose 4,6-dehydratase